MAMVCVDIIVTRQSLLGMRWLIFDVLLFGDPDVFASIVPI